MVWVVWNGYLECYKERKFFGGERVRNRFGKMGKKGFLLAGNRVGERRKEMCGRVKEGGGVGLVCVTTM